MKHILKCGDCGAYTLKEVCPKCGRAAVTPIPPKYSPSDKYGAYRRKAKSGSLKEAGII
ncbi:RNA-protein complex protein Nop10 [Candidatus Woesearchaeota archaeon]|nr:RNA-protein complex protein Nop10 [Candidatus Woesearchaeota archaeon]